MAPMQGQYVAYTFFKVAPEWRRLPSRSATSRQGARSPRWSTTGRRDWSTSSVYSTAGVRRGLRLLRSGRSPSAIWTSRSSAAELNATPLAGWLETPYSYLATTKASQYTSARRARKVVPRGSPYLVVYPFVKVRPWYAPARRGPPASDGRAHRRRRVVPLDPQPHDVLVRHRRPGVHDRVRVRRAGRLHASHADAARVGGEPLHGARHADLRRPAGRDPRGARRARRRPPPAPDAPTAYVCWSRHVRHIASRRGRARGGTPPRRAPTGATNQ